MNRLVKWAAIAVAGIVASAGVLAGSAHLLAEHKRNRVVRIKVAPVAFAAGHAALERGQYLFASRGCGDCHGADGAGRVFIDSPDGLYVRAPNISPGAGGVVARYGEADWVRAIRHCVKPDGRPMLIMPCEDYNRLTDIDLAALVAHARSLSPAAGEGAEVRMPLPVKAVYALGLLQDGAEKVDHTLPPAQPVAEGVSVEHGRYVANMCLGCHGPTLDGGRIPGSPPDWPPASKLAAGESSVMTRYDSADKLKAMFRSGRRPDGSAIAVMPFEALRQLKDTDVAALHLYLGKPAADRGGEALSEDPGSTTMSIRVWWMVAIFTSAVGLAIFFEEPPPGIERGGQPAAQAEVRSAAVAGERPTHPGS